MAKSVYIAALAHAGTLHAPTLLSIIETISSLSGAGIASMTNTTVGNSLPDHNRNAIVRSFLDTECDFLLMVDHDVSWEPGAALRLVNHPVHIVGGIYPARIDPETYYIRFKHENPLLAGDPDYPNLLEMDAVLGGFTRISRQCLEMMVEHYKDDFYTDDVYGGRKTVDLFGHGLKDKRFWGEDFEFCRRWREMGGRVWCDPEIKMGHTGWKVFEGHFGNWLRSRPGNAEVADWLRNRPENADIKTEYEALQAMKEAAE